MITRRGLVVSVVIVCAGGLASCSGASSPHAAPSHFVTPMQPRSAKQGLQLGVVPRSGPIGTQVDVTVRGCEDPSGTNHALSFNDANVAANMAISREHIHPIAAAVVDGTMHASYAIPSTSGSSGTFSMQCGQASESQAFHVIPIRASTARAAARLSAYLGAAAQGDCRAAEVYVLPTESRAGDVCDDSHDGGGLVFDRWRGPLGQPIPSHGAVEFSVDLHLTQKPLAGGTDRPGWTTWFLEFRKTRRGWLLDNGGTGP